MTCTKCGREIEEPGHFCPWCGVFIAQSNTLSLENLELVFMRADLSGFTAMSESMISEDVMAFLSETFGVFSKIIESHKGVVYDIIGDEVVSIFGFPKESGFVPQMAIMAAEELLTQLNTLNKKEYLKRPVGLKIGMAMESASLLNLHRDLRNTLVVTKGFKKCQILQKNAADNTLLVCEKLYLATKAFFYYSEIGEIVKEPSPIKAYEYKVKT